MLPSEELLQSIDILAQNAVKDSVKIYTAIVTSVGDNNTCSVHVNGKTHSNIAYYGDAPSVNKSYRVFCPNGSMNQAFIITGGGSSGGGSTGATDYNQLTNRPSINGTTLSGNQTSSQLGLYGTNNAPPYPVTSVNGQTGNVVISTGGNVDSVNGKTGVVVLNAADVGALPNTTTIPTKTSQLTNDTNYITAAQAPVQSVNNKTGAVTLSASDVSAIPSTLTGIAGQVLTKTADGQEWKDVEIPSGTNDHSKLINRDAADQHPIGAITGLEAALANIPPTDSFIVTLTQDGEGNNTVDKTFAEIVEAIQSNRATYLHSENMYLPLVRYYPESYVAFGFAATGSASVSSALFAIFSNDHVEIQKTVLKKLPNPNALTFTGAVTGSYDGSAPLEVEIPSGGSGLTTDEKTLLLTLVKNAKYAENVQPAYEQLEALFNGGAIVTYTVTNNLTDLTTDNEAATITAGFPYKATLADAAGNKPKSVEVVMGGVDVSGEYYADGVIDIPSVGGELVITAFAKNTYPVIYKLANTPVTCNADLYEDTGLAFGSGSADGYTKSWTMVARVKNASAGYLWCVNGQKPLSSCYENKWNSDAGDKVMTINTYICNTAVSSGITQANPGEVCIVITKEALSEKTATVHYLSWAGAYVADTVTGTYGQFFNSVYAANMMVGGQAGADFVGTIEEFVIYEGIMEEDEIKAVLGV